jgi:sensor histidine kinase regulating citrate/malate metabolism
MHLSIRTKILTGVVLVNVLGAIVVMVYLHQSYSGGVAISTAHTTALGLAAHEQVQAASGKVLDPVAEPQAVNEHLGRMKAISGSEYAFMLDKSAAQEEPYAVGREEAGLPNNWSEGDTYVVVATTDEAAASRMKFNAKADSVPEIGKTIGVENGACAKTCHNGIMGEGDYWGVAWSTDSKSRTHAAFPVTNAEGSPIGVIYALEDISAQADAAKESMLRTLLVIVLTLLVATVLIAGMIDSLVFKRMRRMMLEIEDVSMRVAGGDFDARFSPDEAHDEIGDFERFFAKVLGVLTGTIKSLATK